MSIKAGILRRILERLVEVEPEVPVALNIDFPGWEAELDDAMSLFEQAQDNAASFPAGFVKKDSVQNGGQFWHYRDIASDKIGLYFPYDVYITHGTFQTEDAIPGEVLTMCMYDLDNLVDIPGSIIPLPLDNNHVMMPFSNTFIVPANTRFLIRTMSLSGSTDMDCGVVTLWFRRKL